MRNPVGTIWLGPTGDVGVQTSWRADGENVRIINPITGTAGFQTEDYVYSWLIVHRPSVEGEQVESYRDAIN